MPYVIDLDPVLGMPPDDGDRRPFSEWGPQEIRDNLRAAVGGDVFDWLGRAEDGLVGDKKGQWDVYLKGEFLVKVKIAKVEEVKCD